jgi:hypothetical protein
VPALAQDAGGLLLTFGIEQRIEAGRNLTLDTPETGSGTNALTTLSFGLLSETREHTFSLDFINGLRITNLPGEGTDVGIDDSLLILSYDREVANAALSFDATLSRRDIEFLDPLSSFITDDGAIETPADFERLDGGGTRNEYSLSAEFETGQQDLVGFFLRGTASGLNYSGTTDPDLFDTRTNFLEAGTILRFSPRTTGRVTGSAEFYEADDLVQTDRETYTLAFGLDHELTSRLSFGGVLGYTDVDTFEIGGIPGANDFSGIVGELGLTYAMPNGEITAQVATSIESSGRLNTFLLGRSLEIPNGEVTAQIGVGQASGADMELIGSLNWRQQIGRGDIIADFSRVIGTSIDDEARATTALALGYVYNINPTSRVGLSVAYVQIEPTPSIARVESTDITAVYGLELTPEWDFNTGVRYRIRDEDLVGRAESPSVFISIGRQFDLRP